jgi:hypothetical protein
MRRLAYWLIRLYPKAWRVRYGDELMALLDARHVRLTDLSSLTVGALTERVVSILRLDMQSLKHTLAGLVVATAVMGGFLGLLLLTKPAEMPLGSYAAIWTAPSLVWLLYRRRKLSRRDPSRSGR